jgi:hypothetical protein
MSTVVVATGRRRRRRHEIAIGIEHVEWREIVPGKALGAYRLVPIGPDGCAASHKRGHYDAAPYNELFTLDHDIPCWTVD